MYECGNCDRIFEAALNKQSIGFNSQWVCPYCLSDNIRSTPQLFTPQFFDDQEQLETELQEMGLLDEMPEHPNCRCNPEEELIKNAGFFFPEMGAEITDYQKAQGMTGNGYARLPAQNAELSFGDLDLNEFVLLAIDALDVKGNTEPSFKKSGTYITDMNSRFLHTFIDASFVP